MFLFPTGIFERRNPLTKAKIDLATVKLSNLIATFLSNFCAMPRKAKWFSMAGNNRAIQSPFPRCAHFYTGRRCTLEGGSRDRVKYLLLSPTDVPPSQWQRSRRQRKKYIYRAEAFSERANTILNAQSGFEKVEEGEEKWPGRKGGRSESSVWFGQVSVKTLCSNHLCSGIYHPGMENDSVSV